MLTLRLVDGRRNEEFIILFLPVFLEFGQAAGVAWAALFELGSRTGFET